MGKIHTAAAPAQRRMAIGLFKEGTHRCVMHLNIKAFCPQKVGALA